MSFPNYLANRYPTAHPEPLAAVPKWDPLRYDLLPDEDHPLIDHVAHWDEPVFQHGPQHNAITLTFSLTAVSYIAVHLVYLLQSKLLDSAALPYWFAAAVLGAALTIYSWQRTDFLFLLRIVLIPLIFTAVLYGAFVLQVRQGQARFSHLTIWLPLFLLWATVLDAFVQHAVWWLAAQPAVHRPIRTRLRRLWHLRFHPLRLAEVARMVSSKPKLDRRAIATLEMVATLKRYGAALLYLIVISMMLVESTYRPTVFVISVFLSAVVLVLTTAADDLGTLAADVARILAQATQSWLLLGRRGEHAPGVFRSPVAPRAYRLLFTLGTFYVLSLFLVPRPDYQELAKGFPEFLTVPGTMWGIILSMIASLVLPALTFALALAVFTVPVLRALHRTIPDIRDTGLRRADQVLGSEEEQWTAIVDTLQRSGNPRHRRQLFVGYHATENYPMFLPLDTLAEHAHIVGATGSGKTSRAILPLVAQLARIQAHKDDDKLRRGPILIVDLKGEDYLFHAARHEAATNNRPFKHFTNVTGRHSYAFNPLHELQSLFLTPSQVGAVARAALNVEHGTGYGMGYFSAIARAYLDDILNGNPLADTFRELEQLRVKRAPTLNRMERDLQKEAYELISSIQLLAQIEHLNVTDSTHPELFAHRISMLDAIENDSVIYFYLSSRGDEAVARYIASLALECLYTASVRRNISVAASENDSPGGRPTRKPIYVFVDEFQIVAGRNFQFFMQQARSSGLALVLSNQSREDLIANDLLSAVDQNTAYRQFFTMRTPTALEFIEQMAGVTLAYSPATGPEMSAVAPRFERNDLITLSARADMSICQQANCIDYSQFDGHFVPMRSPYHISLRNKMELEAKHWPSTDAGTVIAGEHFAANVENVTARPSGRAVIQPTPPSDTTLAGLFQRIHIGNDCYTVEGGDHGAK
ncbi:MAG: hypothetical protein HY270_05540 [Deltaproteobacteria bacterium]|nr:hypothetical protein [Deltaproteobacteria bacterium]